MSSDPHKDYAGAQRGARLVERANDVPILDVLRDFLNVYVPEIQERSWKTYCPFGHEHGDGGIERSYRVYAATNSSYCFAGHGGLAPVRLVALKLETRYDRAARIILDRYGLLKPKPWRTRYAELMLAREAATKPKLDRRVVAAALLDSISREPKFAEMEFSEELTTAMDEELTRIDAAETETELREAYRAAKVRLKDMLR